MGLWIGGGTFGDGLVPAAKVWLELAGDPPLEFVLASRFYVFPIYSPLRKGAEGVFNIVSNHILIASL